MKNNGIIHGKGYTFLMETGGVQMIKVELTNEILKRISIIDANRFSLNSVELPPVTKNKPSTDYRSGCPLSVGDHPSLRRW